MKGVIEETAFKFYCDYCSRYEMTIQINDNTSFEIKFYCGGCGHENKFIHASSGTKIRNDLQ